MKIKLSDLKKESPEVEELGEAPTAPEYRRTVYVPANSAVLKDLNIGDKVTLSITGEISSLRDSEYDSEFCLELEEYEVKGKKGSNGVEESNDMDGLLDDEE